MRCSIKTGIELGIWGAALSGTKDLEAEAVGHTFPGVVGRAVDAVDPAGRGHAPEFTRCG